LNRAETAVNVAVAEEVLGGDERADKLLRQE
jgi:hypothetical protein